MKYCLETKIINQVVNMPKEFLEYIDNNSFVVTKGMLRDDHNTLFIFSQKEWDDFTGRLSKLDKTNDNCRRLRRYFECAAADAFIDAEKMEFVIPEYFVDHYSVESGQDVKIYYEDDVESKHYTIEILREREDYSWIMEKYSRIKEMEFNGNSLAELYMRRPKSYIMTADAGFGKTIMLKHFAQILNGTEIYDDDGKLQTMIVVYLSMYDINLMPSDTADKGPIIELLRKLGIINHNVDRAGILEMIKKDESYRYVFLLDGINELHDRHTGMDYLFSIIEKEINDLTSYGNVDIILSTRSEKILPRSIYDTALNENALSILRLNGMRHEEGGADKERILDYLQKDADYVPDDLWEELESPMLLKYYKEIIQRNDESFDYSNIHCKTDLLDCYYNLDIAKYTDNNEVNEWDKIRREYLLKWVLPGVAFYVENELISLVNSDEAGQIELRTIFEEVCDKFEQYYPAIPGGRDNLWNGFIRLQICDENGKFIHDIIREYWASKGLLLRMYYSQEDNEITSFIDNISKNIVRGEKAFEIGRQTRHIGLIEIIYELMESTYGNYEYLCKGYAMARKGNKKPEIFDYKVLFELFFNYMSMLDDLNERDKAAEVGWFAYDGISEDNRKAVFNDYLDCENKFRLVYILNDMGYSTNNSDVVREHSPENSLGNPDSLTLISYAKEILEGLLINEDDLSEHDAKKYHVMMGKLINNTGAYYYGRGDYDKALAFHIEAYDYREKYGIDLSASYKVISSDYFKLGESSISAGNIPEGYKNFLKSYENFKDYLGYRCDKINGTNTQKSMLFSEIDEKMHTKIDYIQIINVLGSQTEILKLFQKTDIPKELFDELFKEMLSELEYCKSVVAQKSRRRMTDTEKKLVEKKEEIRKALKLFYMLQKDEIDELSELCREKWV